MLVTGCSDGGSSFFSCCARDGPNLLFPLGELLGVAFIALVGLTMLGKLSGRISRTICFY